jgi:hypothetical protein
MEGDRRRDGRRRGNSDLLQRQRHADARETDSAGCERHGASDRQRGEADESRRNGSLHVERFEHADGSGEAGCSRDRRPAEQGGAR